MCVWCDLLNSLLSWSIPSFILIHIIHHHSCFQIQFNCNTCIPCYQLQFESLSNSVTRNIFRSFHFQFFPQVFFLRVGNLKPQQSAAFIHDFLGVQIHPSTVISIWHHTQDVESHLNQLSCGDPRRLRDHAARIRGEQNRCQDSYQFRYEHGGELLPCR